MSINRGRVRWQCRRALLELDLVFTRFLELETQRQQLQQQSIGLSE